MSYKDLPPPSPEEAARFRARFDRMVDARVKDRLRTLFEDSRSGLSAEARACLLSLAFGSRQT